jgi:hypothetical protein
LIHNLNIHLTHNTTFRILDFEVVGLELVPIHVQKSLKWIIKILLEFIMR